MDIAYPYAKAIFEIAAKQNKINEWTEFLELLSEVVLVDTVRDLWNCPKSMQGKLFVLLSDITISKLEQLGEFGVRLLRLLINRKHLGFIPQVFDLYKKFYAEYKNIENVEVVSAYLLNSKQQEKLQAILQKQQQQNGRRVNVKYTVDSNLIGGMLIKIGDKVTDYSIRNKLQRFQRLF